MISLKTYVITALIAAVVSGLAYTDGYRKGWEAHSAKVNADYLAKQAKYQRQQANNTEKAAKAETAGEQKQEVIYRDVVKYVKTPGRNVGTFDPERVRIKQRAVANANNIEGFEN